VLYVSRISPGTRPGLVGRLSAQLPIARNLPRTTRREGVANVGGDV